MGKYEPLRDHLARHSADVTMTFDDVADLVGGLPASAYRYAAWWHDFDDTHSQSRAWNSQSFVARPDLANRTVTFRKVVF